MDKLALSIEEAAERSGIGRTLMFDQVRKGNVRSLKVGKRRLILATELHAWLERQQAEQAVA